MPKKGELLPIPHGTYGGAQAHYKRGIPIDAEDSCGCRAARSVWMAEWRAKQRHMTTVKEREELLARKIGAMLMLRHPAEAREIRLQVLPQVRKELQQKKLKAARRHPDDLLPPNRRKAEGRG